MDSSLREHEDQIRERILATDPDIREEALLLHAMVGDLVAGIEDGLRHDIPALHMALDDSDGDAIIIVTPYLNVRFGKEMERLSMLLEADMQMPEIRRALGARASAHCEDFFTLSDMLRSTDLGGVSQVREMELRTMHTMIQGEEAQPDW